jgi:hypothetical protein
MAGNRQTAEFLAGAGSRMRTVLQDVDLDSRWKRLAKLPVPCGLELAPPTSNGAGLASVLVADTIGEVVGSLSPAVSRTMVPLLDLGLRVDVELVSRTGDDPDTVGRAEVLIRVVEPGGNGN